MSLSSVGPSNPSGSSKSSSSSSSSGVPNIPLTLAISGTYGQVTSFITAVNAMPRTLVIDSVNISKSGDTGTLDGSLSTTLFYAGQATP